MTLDTYVKRKVAEEIKFWPPIILKDDSVILIDGINSAAGERPILFVLAPHKLITSFDDVARLAKKHGGIDEYKTFPNIPYEFSTFAIFDELFRDDRYTRMRRIIY